MSLLTLLLIAAAGYGGYKLVDAVQTSAAGEKLMSDIDGLKISNVTSGKLFLDVTFRHANPSSKDLKFDFMFLDFIANNERFASVRQDSLGLIVPKNRTTYQTVRVEVPLIGAGLSIFNLIMAGKKPDKIKIVGPIKVGSYITEYNSEFPVNIPFI
jgi:hypothetical protein